MRGIAQASNGSNIVKKHLEPQDGKQFSDTKTKDEKFHRKLERSTTDGDHLASEYDSLQKLSDTEGPKPSMLSPKFVHNAFASPLPIGIGERASRFENWLNEGQKELGEDWVNLPAKQHCVKKCSQQVEFSGENINITFKPDGTHITVGNWDDELTIIDVPKFKPSHRPKFNYEVNEIAWNTIGRYIQWLGIVLAQNLHQALFTQRHVSGISSHMVIVKVNDVELKGHVDSIDQLCWDLKHVELVATIIYHLCTPSNESQLFFHCFFNRKSRTALVSIIAAPALSA
eukprot:Gb_10990 [translate_table: standard]